MATPSCDIVLVFPPIRTWDNPRNFPTGLGLIAARLRNQGYSVAVIDANGLRLTDQETLDQIQQYNPSVIGIGGLITTYSWVKRMTRQMRQLWPDRKIILGGSVGSSIVETALRKLDIDVIAIGEADNTVLELLNALLNNEDLDSIRSIAYIRDGQVVRTAKRPLISNLNNLPHPAWDMFPMHTYLENPIVGVGRDIDIISSRGCPFNCQYCYRLFGKKFRAFTAEYVVEEISVLKRNYDIDFISFQDDCFVIDKNRVYEICGLLDKKGLSKSLRWSCTGRVSICDSDMLKRMRTSGCVSVSYGIESGSEKILQAMGKDASLEMAKKAIINTRNASLRCPVSFMIGYPGETRQTITQTVDFCNELNIALAAMMFTCPYPGTPLYDKIKNTENFKQQFTDEEQFVTKIGDAVDLTVNLTDMPDKELTQLRDQALELAKQNYLPPSRAELAAQDKQLYGPTLYKKAQRQLRDPQMQAHRQRHGFNESIMDNGKNNQSISADAPAWVDGRIRPYIIAEAGVNHNGNLQTALKLVDAAKDSGADCVKFQAFTADELATTQAVKAAYQHSCGSPGESQYDMLKCCELTEKDFAAIKKHCDRQLIDFLATPFSVRWVRVLAQMGITALKIGSGNITCLDLLKEIAGTHLPVIMSTGMAYMTEINHALNQLRQFSSSTIVVMHCVSLYPTKLEQVNLVTLATLKQQFSARVGFSDHTEETITGALAVAAGADILEKHITLDKNMDGPDHKMSLQPSQMCDYVKLARQASLAYGTSCKEPLPQELQIRQNVRMSVVAARDIKTGATITRQMLTLKRPGTGIPAEEIDNVLGAVAIHKIKAGQLISGDLIK